MAWGGAAAGAGAGALTRGELEAYLLAVAGLAFVLGAVNLARPHKRWLGAGAILLGVAALLYRSGIETTGVVLVCVLAGGCLAKDVSVRRKAI